MIGHVDLERFSADSRRQNFRRAEKQRAGELGCSEGAIRERLRERGLVWHEHSNGKTLSAVPAPIHAAFVHGGGISVDRRQEDPDSPGAYASAVRSLAGGELVAMMPEGTIPRGIHFYEPMSGFPGAARLAHQTRVPVIPFAISGTEQVWPRSSKVPRVANLLNRPEVTVTFGEPVDLKYRSVPRDMERIFDAITSMLPDEVREPERPTLEELARTYPDGKVPKADRWFAVDGEDEEPAEG